MSPSAKADDRSSHRRNLPAPFCRLRAAWPACAAMSAIGPLPPGDSRHRSRCRRRWLPSWRKSRRRIPEQTGVSSASDAATRQKAPMPVTKKQSRSDAIRALGKTVRLRDKDHRRFVLRQACLVCGRVPSDPHHLTFTQPRALGRRVSDEFIVPVCRVHHRELHRSGNEAAWWRKLNIEPIPIALRFWAQSRTDGGQSDPKLWKNTRLDERRTDSKPASQAAASDGASETPA